ncbi:MAG TPA: outer membrane protein transport protein [Thermoanaerobaculia bacterium]|nr:outer membrane protein transport protein [Thermoanaerobaculia bacterium]
MTWRVLGAVVALGALAAVPMHAAGFGIFEQGTKATGMGGAFTAQADDPSALFYNAGGLAFVTKIDGSIGFTYIHDTKAHLTGANPFPGDGYMADQKKLSAFPPHAYYVQPINSTWKFGIGIETPFGLTTQWQNPHDFAGRFLSTKASLDAFDVNPTIAWQVTPNLGIGIGGIARISDVELDRDVPVNNPFTQSIVSGASVKLKGDFKEGYGFNAGLLYKATPDFSLGLSYRSKITVNYTGNARLTPISTGNAQLDAAIAASLPLNTNLPVKTSIDFPAMASLGVAYSFTPSFLVEVDANWTGWSSFKELPITFTGGPTNSLPSSVIPQGWKDVYNYRLGLRWQANPISQWRLGYVYDQTPQPEVVVNPLLPDADRSGYSIGYGYSGGWKADFALMYLPFKDRTRSHSLPGDGPFFGTYQTTAWLLGVTFTF